MGELRCEIAAIYNGAVGKNTPCIQTCMRNIGKVKKHIRERYGKLDATIEDEIRVVAEVAQTTYKLVLKFKDVPPTELTHALTRQRASITGGVESCNALIEKELGKMNKLVIKLNKIIDTKYYCKVQFCEEAKAVFFEIRGILGKCKFHSLFPDTGLQYELRMHRL